jgi:hypothetical protein
VASGRDRETSSLLAVLGELLPERGDIDDRDPCTSRRLRRSASPLTR